MGACQSPSVLTSTQAEMPVYEVAVDSVRDTRDVNNQSYYNNSNNTVDVDTTSGLSPNEYETFKASVSLLQIENLQQMYMK